MLVTTAMSNTKRFRSKKINEIVWNHAFNKMEQDLHKILDKDTTVKFMSFRGQNRVYRLNLKVKSLDVQFFAPVGFFKYELKLRLRVNGNLKINKIWSDSYKKIPRILIVMQLI